MPYKKKLLKRAVKAVKRGKKVGRKYVAKAKKISRHGSAALAGLAVGKGFYAF